MLPESRKCLQKLDIMGPVKAVAVHTRSHSVSVCLRRCVLWMKPLCWLDLYFVCMPTTYLRLRAYPVSESRPAGYLCFAGMMVSGFVVIWYDKRQKTPRLVDIYDELCIELLELLTETQIANY